MIQKSRLDRDRDIEETKLIVSGVDGWLRNDEGVCLYDLARNCKGNGVIVEIGSWKGRSTIWLGRGSFSGTKAKVYAVDPHTGSTEHKEYYGKVNTYDEFAANIDKAELKSLVIPLVMSSQEAALGFTEPVEAVFIDGEHEYKSVRSDFELWSPKVIDGGYIAFHDTAAWRGVLKAVRELIYNSREYKVVDIVYTITVAQKVRQLDFIGMLRNKLLFCDLLFRYGVIKLYKFAYALLFHKPRI
jgi:MMP 1-O-methyltransferase